MNRQIKQFIELTLLSSVVDVDKIHSLWSGCGELLRVHLASGDRPSVILKHVELPVKLEHPRGWSGEASYQRKLKSYQVETHWYESYASLCGVDCIVPACLGVERAEGRIALLLSDLFEVGFSEVKSQASLSDIRACLYWLASFHATFMCKDQLPEAEGLWVSGSYWHLETRQDELEALNDDVLEKCAQPINLALKNCTYQTLVHGDAKLANFCFSPSVGGNHTRAAAVDFQYVGVGCGMKDVMCLLSSCLNSDEHEELQDVLLNHYFDCLGVVVAKRNLHIDMVALEQEWRPLYAYAWADFVRFLKGWSPDHWKIHAYSEALTRRVVDELQPHL